MLRDKIFDIFYMYGLMIAVGILCCFGLLFYYGKAKKIETRFIDFVFYNAIASIAIGFGSATLFQAVYAYIENPAAGFNIQSGMTFIGGLIGGVACFLIIYFPMRKRYKAKLIDILSFAPCCILIAHAFGRLGCFFAGCCYGKPTDSFLGVQFPHLAYKVHPTQLYEAFFLFALCAICFILVWKKNFKHNMSLYLVCYGVFRFCIEFLRGDDRGELIAGISPSQFWSICMVIVGIGLYFVLGYMYKRRALEIEEGEREAAQNVAQTAVVTEKTADDAQIPTSMEQDVEEKSERAEEEETHK